MRSMGEMVQTNANTTAAFTRPTVEEGLEEELIADPDASVSVGDFGTFKALGVSRAATVVSTGAGDGFVRARVVGGRGKLSAVLPPQDWRGYQLGQIASESVTEAGEVAGEGWSSLTESCAHWMRSQGPLRECLRRVWRHAPPDLHWRTAHDGSFAVVDDSKWPDNSANVDREQFSWPQESCVQWYPLNTSAEPGQSITLFGSPRRLTRVEYRLGTSEITARGWY